MSDTPTIEIRLHRISIDADGKQAIEYTLRRPDGSGVLNCHVPLGGSINLEIRQSLQVYEVESGGEDGKE